MKLSKISLFGAVTAVAVLISACGASNEQATPSQTSATESLTVYSGRSEELVAPLFAAFTKQTGIAVTVRYGDTAELAAQLIEEGEATPAQVFFAQDAGALGAVDSAGLFATLPSTVATAVPLNYRSTSGNWTGVSGRARVIAYDSQRVKKTEVPTSIFELTDKKWLGEVAIAPTNASFQSFITAMRVSQGDDVTKKWLTDLVANKVQTYEKNGLILDAVNSGQVKLGLVNHYYWYEKAAELGASNMRAQNSFTKPQDPGSLVNVAGAGILKGAAGNANAQTLVEWLLAKSTQEWFATNTWEYPLVPSVAASEGLPSLESLRGPEVPLAELEDLPGTLSMLQEVGLV